MELRWLCTKSPVSKLILQINEDFLISFWRFFETIEAPVAPQLTVVMSTTALQGV